MGGAGEVWRGSLLGSIGELREKGSCVDITLSSGGEAGEDRRDHQDSCHFLNIVLLMIS